VASVGNPYHNGMEYFAKIRTKANRIHACHVAIAYPFIYNTDKFHHLQQLELIYSVFCFVLQF